MAAPIYNEAQIATLMTTPKYIAWDAWQRRFETRTSGRATAIGEFRHKLKASPVDPKDATSFEVEIFQCHTRTEIAFTLHAKLQGYTKVAVCRYDYQPGRHKNPKWFPPAVISNRVLHRHVYSPRAIREDLPWDACAEVISPLEVRGMQAATDRLTQLFVQGLAIDVHDPDFRSGLFAR
jgi:hypothetical protein